MDPPLAPAKAKKQKDTIAVAQLPKKLDFGRTNARPHTPERAAKQSATKDDTQEPGNEGSTDPPMNALTDANDQLMKAIEMLKTQRTSGENLTIKNAVITILEKLALTNQPLALPRPPQDSTEGQRISNVENDVKEIKETMHELKTMLAANKPLWSTIAASSQTKEGSTRAQIQLETAKREMLEQAREARAKTTVTLTFRNASESVYMALENTSDAATLQRAINESTAKSITIRKIQKLSGKLLKIHCHNEDDAKHLREIEWEKTITGVTLAAQEYGMVLDGVPINILDARTASQKDMRELIQRTNNINVQRVALLTRKPRNPNAPTQSIIIFTNVSKEANEAIEDGIRIEIKNEETHEIVGRLYAAKRYNPQHQIKQCSRCQAYGHKAEACTRTITCRRCAQQHETRTCIMETNKCTHCSGTRPAWHHECPRRIKEHEKLRVLIATAPTLFPC